MNYVLGNACLGFFVEGGPDSAIIHGTGYSHIQCLDAAGFARPSTACCRSTRRPSPSASSTSSAATTRPAC